MITVVSRWILKLIARNLIYDTRMLFHSMHNLLSHDIVLISLWKSTVKMVSAKEKGPNFPRGCCK